MAQVLTDEYIDFSIEQDDLRERNIVEGSAKLLEAILRARGFNVVPMPARPKPQLMPFERLKPRPIKLGNKRGKHNLWPRWYRPPTNVLPLPRETAKSVAKAFRLTLEELQGKGRSSPLIDARAACVAILRRRGMSYPSIGEILRRDHTTILNLFDKLPIYERRNPLVTEVIVRFTA